MDMFYIPRAFLHYHIVPDAFPDHPDTDLVIDIEHRTIYLNLDADPTANVTRTVFPNHLSPKDVQNERRKRLWFQK